jgi:hypothetical protein
MAVDMNKCFQCLTNALAYYIRLYLHNCKRSYKLECLGKQKQFLCIKNRWITLIVDWIYVQHKAIQFISDSKIGYQYEKMLVAQNKTNLLVNIILQTL